MLGVSGVWLTSSINKLSLWLKVADLCSAQLKRSGFLKGWLIATLLRTGWSSSEEIAVERHNMTGIASPKL
ncbi:hypothetical protein CSING_11305 [Corynebacterium singulare]|uniref:Uncharacterized protein n=1 Tax=Corynebacterium singulare TaxID=161899 RepID=A0A0B6ETC4_9CORY|nr:hypothetical protein CSING_11305 [Corynebacterium singulare]